MTTINKIKLLISIAFITNMNVGCESENHIDKYKVNLDSLITLPDNFYAYRSGNIYLEDVEVKEYRIWFNIDKEGNIHNISKIEDFNSKLKLVTKTSAIDTSLSKSYAQNFINLSRQYKFGHIYIDRKNKVSFSYKDGLAEQYVKALNDSVNHIYTSNKNFTLLPNGWFKNVEQ